MQKEVSKRFFHAKLAILLLLGTISWSLTMVKSGLSSQYGIGFWGPNGHDGIWHIALSESLRQGHWEMPVFAGSALKNYHIGFDLLLALTNKLTNIPITNLYFQITPPIFAFLIGFLVYQFMLAWTKSSRSALWSLFFVYFGGDVAWIFGRGESTFWSQQAISTLINPPFAMSLIFIFLGLIFLYNKRLGWAILFFGLLSFVKIYASILVLGSLFICSLFEIYRNKDFFILKVFFGSFILSLILFIPLNKNSTSLLVFSPFWFLETVVAPDRFDWPKLYSAIINYRLAGNWIKYFLGLVLSFLIFWIGNMGTRLVKEFQVFKWIKNIKTLTYLDVFIASIIIMGALIPMVFLQKGTSWNTIQFFYYSLVFSGILAGLAMTKSKNSFAILIVALTIPTSAFTLLNNYLPNRPPAKISQEELQALDFLSKQSQGTVLTFPFDKGLADDAISNPPRSLYLYDSTAYIAAYAKLPVYLEDEVNLDITDYDWKVRREAAQEFFTNPSTSFLKNNNISYVYLVGFQKENFKNNLGLTKIFDNSEVVIYKVN